MALEFHTLGMHNATLTSMNSYHRSVVNPEIPRDLSQETSLVPTMMLMTLMLTKDNLTKRRESLNLRCHGSLKKKKRDALETENVRNHKELSPYSLKTSKPLNNGSKTLELCLLDSQAQSGTTSCEDKPSTSMQCSHLCTIYLLLKRTLDAWDLLRSPLGDLSHQRSPNEWRMDQCLECHHQSD